MEKSKLGISLNLFAALLYFLGAVNIFAVMMAAGYVLLLEDNGQLKKTAVKALILAVFLSVSVTLINWSANLLISGIAALESFITYISQNFRNFYFANLSYNLVSIINIITRIGETLIFVICGFRAYKQIDVKINRIDRILDKHWDS
jgi:hypothetical protein